jgi:hemerythrin superfamily protein
MDAIAFLRQEHSKVRQTFAAIAKLSDDNAKLSKFNALCKFLQRHEKMEETIWYPVLRKDAELRDIIKHLVSEEKHAAKAMQKLKATKMGIIWKLKFYKFKHDVDHHAKSEEKELFPKARKFLTKTELNALGAKMRKFKGVA